MERITGQSVLSFMASKKTVEEHEAKKIMRAVISAIESMHEFGVIHRDMNPTNVFVSDDV